MAIMKAKNSEESSKKWISKMILPVYVILSAIFIIYVAYSFLNTVIYNSGQQQWYETAIIDLMNKVGAACEPVSLTAGETQVDVINIACLQQAPAEAMDTMEAK